MQKKYRALRFVVGLYRVLAWVVLALGVLASIGMIIASITARGQGMGSMLENVPMMPVGTGIVGGLVAAVVMLLYTALLFIIMWAGSEFVMLFLDIERNTRETALYLRGELQQTPPPEAITWQQPGPNV
ncbi:MAG: hypothetical protein GXY68_09615 [Chloroflexi bacterium]|jgi:hypothetical protein|nr:hypothetical protein [Chloroflexota bacterium]